ncbi:MAG: TldD/PmbA family protein [Candidatus Eremiobacteraeota bacterium]|nr:TldD/PmbA family protein [Candidatus Eremiobacteraeota bacterium]MBV9409929.1 TldD/PmbA family protein [Candidatus Eremiobacteraeota bacterium]
MPNAHDALALAKRALAQIKGADQAAVAVNVADASYSRFARNYVVQNIGSLATTVSITYVKGKRTGSSTTGDTSDAGLRAVAARAADVASRVPANPEFVSLPKPGTAAGHSHSVFPATASASPETRIDKLQSVFARMERSSLNSSGYTTTQSLASAVVNSLGLSAAWEGTYAGLEIKAIGERTSGYADFWTRDYGALDAAERAERAASKATVSNEPADFAPGTYTVILEPPAFVDCINNLYYGFSFSSIKENQDSWMIDRIGKHVFSPHLTIVDDWSHPLVANQPFASDGAPTKKVMLVEKGVPKGYVTSTYLANKFKVENTGHDGYPINAIVMPGTKSREQLIAETERGILISRTWYTRPVDPRTCTITGLTRDGVYLIENGKLTKTLKNFRFFTSMVSALKDIELGNKLYRSESSDAPQTLLVPDVKIAKFTLSAQTSFA